MPEPGSAAPAVDPDVRRRLPPAIVWSWERALVGAVFAIPAAIVTLADPTRGIPLAVGVLPAAILPIPPHRADRIRIFLIGTLAGLSLFLGGVLTQLPIAVSAVLLAGVVVAAAAASTVGPNAIVVLVLCAPLVAAGMSYTDLTTSFQVFVLLTAGAAYAWLVSLAWPSRPPPPSATPAPPDRLAMRRYGLRLGIAAAIAYAITASLGLDHAGWAPAACLLVARPQLDLLRTRGVGRVLSVVGGALAAGAAIRADPPDAVYSLATVAVLATAAATAGSRWYITSAFTTFFVFVMLPQPDPDQLAQKFGERVGETILGVGLAYLICWVVPALVARRRQVASP